MGNLTGKSPLARILTRALRNYVGLLLAVLMILSCAGYTVRGDRPRGVYHRVKSGETLLMISRAYRVDLQELAELNNIDDPNRIEADSVIFIPDAQLVLDDIVATVRPQPVRLAPTVTPPPPAAAEKAPAPPPKAVSKPESQNREATVQPRKRTETPPASVTVRDRPEPPATVEKGLPARRPPAKPEKEETAGVAPKTEREGTVQIAPRPESREAAVPAVRAEEGEARTDQIQFDKKRFIWPVRGKVVSRFGIQPNRMYYNGIRIAAGDGTAVQAAADGHVVFSASLKDYGETIIIQHEAQYATVYAHLGTRTVRAETRVKKGDRIAFLGKVDPPEESYLHFEIRQKNKARNPLFFLP